jgi:Zn-dependent protease with chaperone function
MNFFQHQAHARAMTRNMLLLFALSVLLIIGFITVVLALIARSPEVLLEPGPWLVSSISIGGLIAMACAYRILSLRDGGAAIAHALGATQINHHADDPHYRRLLNVVEEIAIASGLPCPDVFVLEDEDGINAFAAGYSQADAAVAVTRGALMKLSRDELQGVIAHEFSHVLNGDMRLNIRLVGVLFGISVLGLLGYKLMRAGGSSRDGASAAAIGAVIAGFGYLGLLCGRIIKAHISRSREFLADASAVQFTRSTSGIAGALKKIAGFQAGSALQHRESEQYAHMLFGSLQTQHLFDTHPDVRERIKRLEPSFSTDTLQLLTARESKLTLDANHEPASAIALLGRSQHAELAPARLIAQIANPEPAHVRVAAHIHRGLHAELLAAAHDREAVIALLLALALSRNTEVQTQQLGMAAEQLATHSVQTCIQLLPLVQALKPQQRLPLACVAFPTLKLRSAASLQQVFALLQACALADHTLDVFEYSLLRLLAHSCLQASRSASTRAARRGALDLARAEVTLLQVIAHCAHADDAAASQAFAAGLAQLSKRATVAFQRQFDWTTALDAALETLATRKPEQQQTLIQALLASALHDKALAASEAELLRVVCAYLRCPMPPVLQLFELER